MMMSKFSDLINQVKACTICEPYLEHGVRPILQIDPQAKILIACQAPGKKAHQSGIPFDDASGERLRNWMGISTADFYDATKVAILPMGFCYPGTGKSDDLAPRPECAIAWREKLLSQLQQLQLTLVIGQYAQQYHLNHRPASLTDTVRSWPDYWPDKLPLPHPSPRNNRWLKQNPWFEQQIIPVLRQRVEKLL